MSVADDIGHAACRAVARFHLAPGLTLDALGDSRWRVCEDGATLAEVEALAGNAHAEPSLHASRFGVVEPTVCLAVALAAGRALTRWTWVR